MARAAKKNAGDLLRKAREDKGATIRSMEEKHHLATGTWSRWELAGKPSGRIPHLYWAIVLRDEYDVPVDAWPCERPMPTSQANGHPPKKRKPKVDHHDDAPASGPRAAVAHGGMDEW